MPDYIGRIEVPTIPVLGSFPFRTSYPWARSLKPQVYIHTFQSGNAKIEQRFLAGLGTNRFSFQRRLTVADVNTLKIFYDQTQGGYGAFSYDAPNDDNQNFTTYGVHFDDLGITFDAMTDAIHTSGIVLAEVPTTFPTYAVTTTLTRFPNSGLAAGLLDQNQIVIPLIHIRVTDGTVADIYLSDRTCTVGGVKYLARLLDWSGIGQDITGASDSPSFVFGNADQVMSSLVNDTTLDMAWIEFSLYHAGTGAKLDLWAGEIIGWDGAAGPKLTVHCGDPLANLKLLYPPRKISRRCWKPYKDPNTCRYVGSMGDCPKSFEDCQARGNTLNFGAIKAEPQGVRIKVSGFQGVITDTSQVADTVFDQPIPEVYCLLGDNPDPARLSVGMPVNCKIIAGRDEGDFYDALGIVSIGPIGKWGRGHKLDGSFNHGYPNPTIGLRVSDGNDPAWSTDPFALGDGSEGNYHWPQIFAAGVAFIELRRMDLKGLQYTRLDEHTMEARVLEGLKGWVWHSGVRSWESLVNPVWIAINAYLKIRGYYYAEQALQESAFDLTAAQNAAYICDLSVPVIIGEGTERQFTFMGVIETQKPLSDWLVEILTNCLGYYSFAFGKLRIGIRGNSSSTEAFDESNIVMDSLEVAAPTPQFNQLTVNFANITQDALADSVTFDDVTHAERIGRNGQPRYLKGSMNLSGASTKSQAARIATTRVREELGGTTADEQKNARAVKLKTTILGIMVEPGTVCRLDSERVPGGTIEFRAESWRLNRDFSLDITGRPSCDSMYDLVAGPKPADINPNPLVPENTGQPDNWNIDLATDQRGNIIINNLTCATNAGGVDTLTSEIYYIPETLIEYASIAQDLAAGDETLHYYGQHPVDGEWIQIGAETMRVVGVDPNARTATVVRGDDVFDNPLNPNVTHKRLQFLIGSQTNNAEFGIPPGLEIEPGWAMTTNPQGEVRYVTNYNNSTGACVVNIPYTQLTVGQLMYSDPRVYQVKCLTEITSLGANFFRSPARARFELKKNVPFAGVVAFRAFLDTRYGVRSTMLLNLWPQRLRTLGTTQYRFTHPRVPAGVTNGTYEAVVAEADQSFFSAVAEKSKGTTAPPIARPGGVSAVTPTNYQPGGYITLGGSVTNGSTFSCVFMKQQTLAGMVLWTNVCTVPQLMVTPDVPETQTLYGFVEYFVNWMNGGDEFRSHYVAHYLGDVRIAVSDLRGIGGTIGVYATGTLSATCSGITSTLNIQIGRKYAVTYYDANDGYESEPSQLSGSTGPSGGATQIYIAGIPTSNDPRVTHKRLWAAGDGDESKLYFVAEMTNVAWNTDVVDSFTESTLRGRTVYAGPTQPPSPGMVYVNVYKDNTWWFQLRIPTGAGMSTVLDGRGLGNINNGSPITIDVNNLGDPTAVDVILQ